MDNEIEPEVSPENENTGINPAWNDLLSAIPEENHDAVIPHLRQWDSGVQDKFQQVQSEWADYKFLKENEISPDDTRMALGVLRAIQEDPESVYSSLAESYGFGKEVNEENSGQENSGQGENDLSNLPPGFMEEFNRLKGAHETMAQILLEKQKQEETEQQDAELQAELASLKDKHGSFNEKFVLAQMLNGASGEDAMKEWTSIVEQIKTENARPPAPRLLGSNGGGIPGEKAVDPTKLSNSETKNLVANYLKDINRANQ